MHDHAHLSDAEKLVVPQLKEQLKVSLAPASVKQRLLTNTLSCLLHQSHVRMIMSTPLVWQV